MSDYPAETPTKQKPDMIGGQVSLALNGPCVVLPLEAYNRLLELAVAVEAGKLIPEGDVQARIREEVERTISAFESAVVDLARGKSNGPKRNVRNSGGKTTS